MDLSFTWTTVSTLAVSSLRPSAEKLKAQIWLVVGYRAGNALPVTAFQRKTTALSRWPRAATISVPSGEIASAVVLHTGAGWGHWLTSFSVARSQTSKPLVVMTTITGLCRAMATS